MHRRSRNATRLLRGNLKGNNRSNDNHRSLRSRRDARRTAPWSAGRSATPAAANHTAAGRSSRGMGKSFRAVEVLHGLDLSIGDGELVVFVRLSAWRREPLTMSEAGSLRFKVDFTEYFSGTTWLYGQAAGDRGALTAGSRHGDSEVRRPSLDRGPSGCHAPLRRNRPPALTHGTRGEAPAKRRRRRDRSDPRPCRLEQADATSQILDKVRVKIRSMYVHEVVAGEGLEPPTRGL